MRTPSIKRLLATFRYLTPDSAKMIKRLASLQDDADELRALIDESPLTVDTARYAAQCHGDPFDSGMWRTTMILHAVDRIVDGSGIEPLGEVHMSGPPYEYVNVGDPYTATLIYKKSTNNLYIGCYGDIVERGEVR